ncbi:MAG: diacylglycerol O-acyltransferase / wax synthase [Frankiales bacterium]|nr:diacylglycerol O-acyltransferase / wax synthase [Frankiales bacterium]
MPGVDAGYFYMETPSLHMHTLKIAVLDPPEGYHFDMLREELDRRLHLLPPFSKRVLPVPGGLYHPMWFEDASIDLADHVHRVVLPSPGTWEQVEEEIGRIASTPLDRTRPLWEAHAIEGLADGRIVIVSKVHHALADGVASATLLANVMDSTPTHVPVAQPEAWHTDALPSNPQLLGGALRDLLRDLLRLPGLLIRTLRSVLHVVQARRDATVKPPRPILDAPRTSFNRAITPRRSFATTSLSIDQVKIVRRAFGASFTDVVLAVVGGAMREWLMSRGELPERSLLAGVPVANDDALGSNRLIGNKVSNIFTSLGTDVADPVERLRRIGEVTAASRKMQELLGLDMLESWVQYAPPALMSGFMKLYSRLGLASKHPPPFNVVVSNVPGPREELDIAGARLVDLYSVGPILEGIGLNITVWSYLDRLNFSAIACPDTLPDLRGIVDRLQPALGELVKAAENSGSSAS